jgi:antitoxin component of MazEF toxin-antitoxin module
MDLIKIQKNGGGHSIMIPAAAMRALNLQRSDVLGCDVIDGKLSYEVLKKHTVPSLRRGQTRQTPASNRELKS